MVLAVEHKRENAKFAEKNGRMGLPEEVQQAGCLGIGYMKSAQTDQTGISRARERPGRGRSACPVGKRL